MSQMMSSALSGTNTELVFLFCRATNTVMLRRLVSSPVRA